MMRLHERLLPLQPRKEVLNASLQNLYGNLRTAIRGGFAGAYTPSILTKFGIRAHRHPGGLRGRIHIASDFDETPDEVADLFENS